MEISAQAPFEVWLHYDLYSPIKSFRPIEKPIKTHICRVLIDSTGLKCLSINFPYHVYVVKISCRKGSNTEKPKKK